MTTDTDTLNAAYSRLGCMLDESAALDTDVTHLLEAAWGTSTERQTICFAYCKAALEHAISQRTLLSTGQSGTALALTRLHFETVVRAAWINLSASDRWLSEFTTPIAAGEFNEPILGPPIPSMLDSIALKQPELEKELRKLNETVKVMHSFVHGGVHLVVHALRGYPPDNLISLLRNRNLLTLQLCNVIVGASGRASLFGSVGRLSRLHANCMPPASLD